MARRRVGHYRSWLGYGRSGRLWFFRNNGDGLGLGFGRDLGGGDQFFYRRGSGDDLGFRFGFRPLVSGKRIGFWRGGIGGNNGGLFWRRSLGFLIRKSKNSANARDVDREDEEEGCGERNTEAFLFGDGLQIFRLIDPV